MATEYTPGALNPEAVLTYANNPKEGGSRGATMTIVNEVSGNRVTVRFRKPRGFNSVLVDVMDGPDNESSYSFAGSLRGATLHLSPKRRVDEARAKTVKAILDWTFSRVEGGHPLEGTKPDGTPFKVVCLHEGRCACCGRKLTVPESIETGIGPVCAAALAA